MTLADLARGAPERNPTGQVAALLDKAASLERRAAVASAKATAAERRYRAAQRNADSLQSRADSARRSLAHRTKRVRALGPKYEYSDQTAASSDCDSNYEGACLDPNSLDYDCERGSGDGPDYTGYVEVVGDDPFDLDRDGDGVGCE